MKGLAISEHSEEKQFQWEILFDKELLSRITLDEYRLPTWAGTWKFINFAFRQQKKNWDCGWPDYPQNVSNKFDQVQQLMEQVGIIINIITVIYLWSIARSFLYVESPGDTFISYHSISSTLMFVFFQILYFQCQTGSTLRLGGRMETIWGRIQI